MRRCCPDTRRPAWEGPTHLHALQRRGALGLTAGGGPGLLRGWTCSSGCRCRVARLGPAPAAIPLRAAHILWWDTLQGSWKENGRLVGGPLQQPLGPRRLPRVGGCGLGRGVGLAGVRLTVEGAGGPTTATHSQGTEAEPGDGRLLSKLHTLYMFSKHILLVFTHKRLIQNLPFVKRKIPSSNPATAGSGLPKATPVLLPAAPIRRGSAGRRGL